MEQIPINSNRQKPVQYLDYLINPSFYSLKILRILLFENTTDKTVHTKYYLTTVEIKYFKVMINEQNCLTQPMKNNLRTCDNIQKIAIGQGDDFTNSCLLDYNYFNKYYKMIAIVLRKQKALYADPKAIQKIKFTGNLAPQGNANKSLLLLKRWKKLF